MAARLMTTSYATWLSTFSDSCSVELVFSPAEAPSFTSLVWTRRLLSPASAEALKLDRGDLQSAGQPRRSSPRCDSTHHHVAPDLAEGAYEVSVVVVVHLSQRGRHAGHEATLQEGRDTAPFSHHRRHKAAAAAGEQRRPKTAAWWWLLLFKEQLLQLISLTRWTVHFHDWHDRFWWRSRSERQLRGTLLERKWLKAV